MQHKALPVDPHADPLNLTVQHGLAHFELDHVSLHRTVVERFADGVIVKVASDQFTLKKSALMVSDHHPSVHL